MRLSGSFILHSREFLLNSDKKGGTSMSFLLFFEIVGTVSFAISGVMVGLSKKMDVLGIVVLGITAATGGGLIRDVILGNTPPMLFRDPLYAGIALVTSVIVLFPFMRKFIVKEMKVYNLLMLILDSLGLGVFTVVGIKTAYTVSSDYNGFLLAFVGVITGVGGGILRDVLAGNTPYIFVKHFYATASIIGAVITVVLWDFIGEHLSMILGASVIVVLRFLAARFRWSLPVPKE